MRFKKLGFLALLVLALAVVLPFSAAAGGSMHVRWDIISLVGGGFPGPANPGGTASASTPDGEVITLTGTGAFVAPASSGGSSAATGGGTWRIGTTTGTYKVTGLVSFVFANFQSQTPTLIDNIGNTLQRANGTAVLKIKFSDGSSGVLTVGCHGPGAPAGIFEGIATTKGYKTYYNVPAPLADVDEGRTLFHVH